MTLSDEELRAKLERRAKAAPLGSIERAELIEVIHEETSMRRARSGSPQLRWALPAAAVLAAIVLLVALALPHVLGPAASPGADADKLLLTADELIAVAHDPGAIGRVVIANVVTDTSSISTEDQSSSVLVTGEQPPQADSPVPLVFRVGNESVEYIGPANVREGQLPWIVGDITGAPPDESDPALYPVDGWLVDSYALSCPAPPNFASDPPPDMSYYCETSWLTGDREYSVLNRSSNFVDARVAFDGLHVQNGSYRSFADDPQNGWLGAEPRQGIYLVRAHPCPDLISGTCPVFEMVARLNAAPPSATPAPSAPTPPGSSLLTTDDLVALSRDSSAAGRIVIANALIAMGPIEDPGQSPLPRVVVVSTTGESVVVVGTAAPQSGPSAFRVGAELEYLGPAKLPADGFGWSVAAALSSAPADSSDDLYPVEGWLMQTLAAPCVAPPDFSAPQDYWCGGSWLGPEPPPPPADGSFSLSIPGAMHVQWPAYQDFALDPQLGANGGEPRFGIYLVRPAGCPPNVMGDCPVWEMTGRLEAATAGVPVPPTPNASIGPTASPSPSPSFGFVFCTRIDEAICLEAAQQFVGSVSPHLAVGAGLLLDYSCPPGAWCGWSDSFVAVEVVPGWEDAASLRSFIVTLPVDPGGASVVETASIPDFVVAELPRGGPWLGSLPAASPTEVTSAGTKVSDERNGIRMTVRFAKVPLVAGSLNELETELFNGTPNPVEWNTDPCEMSVLISGRLSDVYWPTGLPQSGVAQRYKQIALGDWKGAVPLAFSPIESIGQAAFGCGDMGFSDTIPAGKSVTKRLFWDGFAYPLWPASSWPAPPGGTAALTISSACLVFVGSDRCSAKWSFEHSVPVTGEIGGGAALTPADAIDKALGVPEFVDFLGTVNLDQANPVYWYDHANELWHVGVVLGSYPELSLHLVEINAITGDVLNVIERPWDKDKDPRP